MIERRARLLEASSLGGRESRRLLAWALERGADEFTLSVMALQGIDAPRADAFEDALAPWAREPATRNILYGSPGPLPTGEVRLWALTPLSLVLLEEFLPDGLFSYDTQEIGWFEDPIVYRRGALLVGVITHEREGILHASDEERAELAALGVVTGESGWPIP